jgi:hypothetical protein
MEYEVEKLKDKRKGPRSQGVKGSRGKIKRQEKGLGRRVLYNTPLRGAQELKERN